MGKMLADILLVVVVCLAASTAAHHHHPSCHSPNMTGFLSVLNLKGELKAFAAYTYDSNSNKLRLRSNESQYANTTLGLDLLVYFDEGTLYEIDSNNHSCEKKSLQYRMHPLKVPSDATYIPPFHIGNPSIEGEGMKVSAWTGKIPGDTNGHYSMSLTMGCMPVSAIYFSDTTGLIFSILNTNTEIKDPDLLVLPSFCEGVAVMETINNVMTEFV